MKKIMALKIDYKELFHDAECVAKVHPHSTVAVETILLKPSQDQKCTGCGYALSTKVLHT